MELPEIESKIEVLEGRKAGLIDQIRQLNRRLHYKQYECRSLEPFVERTKTVRTDSVRRQKNAIEFRIATEAYTPRMEREWLKEAKQLDGKMSQMREIEWARRKLQLVKGDIAECEKGIGEVETQLRTIREELKKLYDEAHHVRAAMKRAVKFGEAGEEMVVTLGDIGIIEKV